MKRLSHRLTLAALGATILIAGCGEEPPGPTVNVARKRLSNTAFAPNVDAGWPVAAPADPMAVKQLSASKAYVARPDPFALLSPERNYETKQLAERIFQDSSGFSVMVTPAPERASQPAQVFENQPYRRLAGVLVGDSIMAIIEMGDGQPPHIVRPGQMIPNTEWRVVSIDEDKAVLRRAGNRLPKEVTVRLESRPAGGGGVGGVGGGRAGGPGGDPAGGPAGGPGGPNRGGGGGRTGEIG